MNKPEIHGRFALVPLYNEKEFRVTISFTVGPKSYQFGLRLPFETIQEIEDASEIAFAFVHREGEQSGG